jgi:UrcA family protein
MRFTILESAAAFAAFGLLCGAAAIAEDLQEVQVQANRIVSSKLVGRSASGVPITEVSVAYRVNLSDLNLGTNSGATEAERRVSTAAAAACKLIARQYPRATPSDRECAKDASDKAMIKVHELVAAAESGSGHG